MSVARLEQQRNTLVVVNDVVERRRRGAVVDLKRETAVLAQLYRIYDAMFECADLLQIYHIGLRADETSRDFHLRRLTRSKRRQQRHGRENCSVHSHKVFHTKYKYNVYFEKTATYF